MGVNDVGIAGQPAINLTAWQRSVRDALNSSDVPVDQRMPRDTGWRNISSLLVNGFSGSVFIRRIGWDVHIMLDFVSRALAFPSTMGIVAAAPSGFGPPFELMDYSCPVFNLATATAPAGSVAYVGGQKVNTNWIVAYNWPAGCIVTQYWSYATRDTWPTTLPGTPH